MTEKEDVGDAEQLPVSSLKKNDSPAELHQAVYWRICIQSDLIAYLTHSCTDLTHFHLHSHSY